MSGDDEFTAADLRDRVFSKLAQSGVVDSLKTQLRAQILRSLNFQNAAASSAATTTQMTTSNAATAKAVGSAPASLRQHIANALVAEYLEAAGMSCTLSVFLPESGSAAATTLTRTDVLAFLRLPPRLSAAAIADIGGDTLSVSIACLQPALQPRLTTTASGVGTAVDIDDDDKENHSHRAGAHRSLFYCLVDGLAERADALTRRAAHQRSCGAQTDWHIDACERDLQAPTAAALQLEWKLDAVDRHYRALSQQQLGLGQGNGGSGSDALHTAAYPAGIEERIGALQREIAERCQREAALEIERVRHTEIAQVRIEEQAKYQQQVCACGGIDSNQKTLSIWCIVA